VGEVGAGGGDGGGAGVVTTSDVNVDADADSSLLGGGADAAPAVEGGIGERGGGITEVNLDAMEGAHTA
jgi:hypothetical protein